MKILIILIICFSSILGNTCPLPVSINQKIYNQIINNKPTINKLYAKRLSIVILEETKKVNINPYLFTAILMQESSYNPSAKNCKETKVGYEICTDFGLSQIHYLTVQRYGFDKKRLVEDMEYSVKAGLQVLSDFKKSYGHKEEDFWTRYNSGKPSARKKYKERVEQWM